MFEKHTRIWGRTSYPAGKKRENITSERKRAWIYGNILHIAVSTCCFYRKNNMCKILQPEKHFTQRQIYNSTAQGGQCPPRAITGHQNFS